MFIPRVRFYWLTLFLAWSLVSLGYTKEKEKGPELDIEPIPEEPSEALTVGAEMGEEGDMKTFSVVTDDNISTLEVNDVYKNDKSVYKVTKISSKGKEGGSFEVKRTQGKEDPMRKWNRVTGSGPPTIVSRVTALDTFMSGGFLMYPIALLLLATIVISLNNIWLYRRERQCPHLFVESAREELEKGNLKEFEDLALKTRGLFASICRAMTANFKTSTIDDIKARCEVEAMRQIEVLRVPLKSLNFIATVAPLLGLLGTVTGLVQCFESLEGEMASASKSAEMATGIKVALLTTVAGLCVAIPGLFAYFFFNQRFNVMVADCNAYAEEFVHKLAPYVNPEPAARVLHTAPGQAAAPKKKLIAKDQSATKPKQDPIPEENPS